MKWVNFQTFFVCRFGIGIGYFWIGDTDISTIGMSDTEQRISIGVICIEVDGLFEQFDGLSYRIL